MKMNGTTMGTIIIPHYWFGFFLIFHIVPLKPHYYTITVGFSCSTTSPELQTTFGHPPPPRPRDAHRDRANLGTSRPRKRLRVSP